MKRFLLVLVACSSPPKPIPEPPKKPVDDGLLAALPVVEPIDTQKFAGVVVCVRCHQANDDVLRDKRGRDVSPITEIAAGMMGLSARDPYYLAALRRELIANPGAAAQIQTTCIRCHAPVGFAEASTLALDDLIAGKSPAAILGREGAGCAGCHALDPDTLGKEPGFTGGAPLRTDRVSFGALAAPLEDAMLQMSHTKPVRSSHIEESRLCASCHSVFVHRLDTNGAPVGDEIAEQATYLEWRNSEFQTETQPTSDSAATCQDCHMPQGDDEIDRSASTIATAFSTRPPDAPLRPFYRRHTLRGGNVYMLSQLAKATAWLGAGAAEHLAESAEATKRFLTTAAQLSVVGVGQELRVTVINQTGHKLPTGYPTRRMWLHVKALDTNGQVVFESGKPKHGAIYDGKQRIDREILPHVNTVSSSSEVAIWEAVPVDESGKRTHLLLGTARIAKDDRILPRGWRDDHPDVARMKPIGVEGDSDFMPGRDSVMYILPVSTHIAQIELLYQAVPPETLESYKPTDSREAARFLAIAAEPPEPQVLATATAHLQATP